MIQKEIGQNAQDIEQVMREYGELMARLLAAAKIPDEQKEAWAALIPEMTFDQLDKLADILGRSVEAAEMEQMKEFREKIAAVQKEYLASVAEARKEADSGLLEVMKEVKAAEAEAQE